MKIDLCDEAAEFGRHARHAFGSAGGDELAQAAERDPAGRGEVVEKVLADLGAWDLDPRRDADEVEAAAALCRSAGYWALPYPLAERLARPSDLESDGLLVVNDAAPAAAVADLDLRWVAVTLDGTRSRATARPSAAPVRKTAFVADVDLEPLDAAGAADVALGLVLPCWTLLGMLDRAMDVTCAYVLDRQQFGQPLSSFQGVQFQLTDAEVERNGVEVLAKYALWSAQAGRADAVDDALALRMAAIEAAEVTFRVAHQLHGAIGFCDETPLSWVSRASQPLRRLPLGLSATRDALTSRLGRDGLTGLFGDRLAG
jgi:hypothetical protein